MKPQALNLAGFHLPGSKAALGHPWEGITFSPLFFCFFCFFLLPVILPKFPLWHSKVVWSLHREYGITL